MAMAGVPTQSYCMAAEMLLDTYSRALADLVSAPPLFVVSVARSQQALLCSRGRLGTLAGTETARTTDTERRRPTSGRVGHERG